MNHIRLSCLFSIDKFFFIKIKINQSFPKQLFQIFKNFTSYLVHVTSRQELIQTEKDLFSLATLKINTRIFPGQWISRNV